MNRLIFDNVEVSKKEFYERKKAVSLKEVDINKIVVSNKIKGNNETSKVFIGYLNDINSIVTPLCIILPQMKDWLKYFENGGKNMSFKIEDASVYVKYNSIWNKTKELLGGITFYSEPIYDDSYIKTKVKTFSNIIKTLFDGDEIPKERVEYVCIPCIGIDSVLKVDKKNYPQVYLEQCKYKLKKREMKSFIDYEIDLDSDSNINLHYNVISSLTKHLIF